MKDNKKFWLVFVNALTISRVIASIFVFPIYFHFGAKVVGYILAAFYLTDWIDGFLARKFKVCTFFGSIMDTICDKTIMIISCAVLCYLNPYMVYVILCEILIFLISSFNLTQDNEAKSLYIGKVKMWVLCMCVVAGFFFCKPDKELINIIVFIPAGIFEILTLIVYFNRLFSKKIVVKKEKPKYKSRKEINKMLFSPEFYEQNKDKTGLLNNIYDEGK